MKNFILSQIFQACFEETHRNKNHPKKLNPKSKSEEKKYSEWAENGSLGSENSQVERGLLEWAECRKKGQKKRRTNPLHPSRTSLKILLSIHWCLHVVFSFFLSHQDWVGCLKSNKTIKSFLQKAQSLIGKIKKDIIPLKKNKNKMASKEDAVSQFFEKESVHSKKIFEGELLELSPHRFEEKKTLENTIGSRRWVRLSVVLVIHCCLPIFSMPAISKTCQGRFVNPVTDICWSCLFPITIGPVKVNTGGREDTSNPIQIPCLCPRPPLPLPVPGIPVGFWEPARLVDVTRTPYCMVNMGGLQLGKSYVGQGVHGAKGTARTQSSFYQVHWYVYPVIYWLELLTDFLCLEHQNFDVAYITELDPLWNADELSFILNPEAVLFSNPIAQAACAADCAATSAGFPMDALFWCGGCQGSLYPFTGNNAAHIGGVQASLLLTQRMMAKLHRELLLWGTSGTSNHEICQKYPMPIIKKSQYKTQMTYPRPTTRGPMACNPLGRTEVVWGSGREFPYKGEDFGYLIWRKRNCCLF